MTGIDRRDLLKLLASAPLAAGFAWTEAEASQAHHLAQAAVQAAQTGASFTPTFFTKHEYETVRALVDLIIPRDERSGSATEAGVPEFIDFMMIDQPARQTAMRGGLGWLDLECQKRYDRMFLECGAPERTAVLDDIAWPDRARPEMSHGVAFFNSFRDLTATGFWTSKMGMEDLQYLGNTFVGQWTGCPEEALKRLGVRYPSE
jgi:hypothetical protein